VRPKSKRFKASPLSRGWTRGTVAWVGRNRAAIGAVEQERLLALVDDELLQLENA
jgi:hypothetical protein